jgi:hypothetical protein
MSDDLAKSGSVEHLPWDPKDVLASLTKAVKFATGEAEGAIAWYLKAKRPKQSAARALRANAVVLAALAGILPMLTQLDVWKAYLNPVFASVFLGVAGACVALDRYFGFSSGWIRYITAELQLRQLLQEFTLDWQAELASWKGLQPTEEQTQKVLTRCRAFVTQVNTIVRDETALWVAEFQDTLKQLDETVKARAAASVNGGIAITVTNGDQCDAAGWSLSVDEAASQKHSGKTAAITGVVPGLHRVKVEGVIQAHPRRAEAAVTTASGTVATVELTLT